MILTYPSWGCAFAHWVCIQYGDDNIFAAVFIVDITGQWRGGGGGAKDPEVNMSIFAGRQYLIHGLQFYN